MFRQGPQSLRQIRGIIPGPLLQEKQGRQITPPPLLSKTHPILPTSPAHYRGGTAWLEPVHCRPVPFTQVSKLLLHILKAVQQPGGKAAAFAV